MSTDLIWVGLASAAVVAYLASVLLWRRRRRRRRHDVQDDALADAAEREGWQMLDDATSVDAVAAALATLGPPRPLQVWRLAGAVRHSRNVRCFDWGWRERAGRRGAMTTLPAMSLSRLAARLAGGPDAPPLPGRQPPGHTDPSDHLRRTADPPFATADIELTVGALRQGDGSPSIPAALRLTGTERAPEIAGPLVAALREAAAALPPDGRLRLVGGDTTLFLGTSLGADVPWDVLMRAIERVVGTVESVER